MKLSVIIPVYNEIDTVLDVIRTVQHIPLPDTILDREIIVVDDGSTDGTRELLSKTRFNGVSLLLNRRNRGKGFSVSNGLKKATGDIVIIQDADLEYHPKDFPLVLAPILSGKADFVNGSRFLLRDDHSPVGRFWHTFGNKMLTLVSNTLADIHLTDTHSCYKAFNQKALNGLIIEEQRFGIEAEVVAKMASKMHAGDISVYEVGISYNRRDYKAGKKIGVKDLFRTLWCNLKYNTSKFAVFVKYLINGTLLAGVQFGFMIALMEGFHVETLLFENSAYAVSMLLSTLVAFYIHSTVTWRTTFSNRKKKLIGLRNFFLVSVLSIALRQLVFYTLSVLGVGYLLNTLIGVVVLVCFNFLGYTKFVFRTP